MKQLFLFILFPFAAFSQHNNYEKFDSIKVDEKSYSTYFFNMEKNSLLNLAKVFVVKNKDFKKTVKKIPKIYAARKQEFTDFYVIALESMDNKVIVEYLNLIDSDRMKRNKSTFLRISNYDIKSHSNIYSSKYRNLVNGIDNVHFLKSSNEICKYMFCPK